MCNLHIVRDLFYVTADIKDYNVHKQNKNQSQEVLPERLLTDGWSHWDILERDTDFSKCWCQPIPPQNTQNPAINQQETSVVIENTLIFKPELTLVSGFTQNINGE